VGSSMIGDSASVVTCKNMQQLLSVVRSLVVYLAA